VLPKAGGGGDLALLDSRLAVREALHGLPDGNTRILAIATETAAAMFALGSYSGASPRLAGLAWGGEDLSADIGALATRSEGEWTEPFRLARNLCLFAAAAAGVSAIDTVYTDFRDLDGLKRECEAAARDGFSGKLAVHPAQVPVINAAFTPDAGSVERAGRIVAAFAQSHGLGVTSLDGMMLDRPHLRAAERLLARAGRDASAAEPPQSDPAGA
jgi:citrate lyase subunit beta / citryl-CoA lyase